MYLSDMLIIWIYAYTSEISEIRVDDQFFGTQYPFEFVLYMIFVSHEIIFNNVFFS